MDNQPVLYQMSDARRLTAESQAELRRHIIRNARINIDQAIAHGLYHAEVRIARHLLPQAYTDLIFELKCNNYRFDSVVIDGDRYVTIYWGPVEEPRKARGFWSKILGALRGTFQTLRDRLAAAESAMARLHDSATDLSECCYSTGETRAAWAVGCVVGWIELEVKNLSAYDAAKDATNGK